MALIVFIYFAVVLLFCLPGYVLTGIGLYAIGSRRGIENPWRAWVPGVNLWLIGCLSDQYQAIVRGKQKYKRLVILGLLLADILLTSTIVLLMDGPQGDNIVLFLVLFALLWGAAAVAAVVGYMALYDVYVSCDPKNKVLYLVLSIVLPITAPVWLFLCRNKDLGFPL